MSFPKHKPVSPLRTLTALRECGGGTHLPRLCARLRAERLVSVRGTVPWDPPWDLETFLSFSLESHTMAVANPPAPLGLRGCLTPVALGGDSVLSARGAGPPLPHPRPARLPPREPLRAGSPACRPSSPPPPAASPSLFRSHGQHGLNPALPPTLKMIFFSSFFTSNSFSFPLLPTQSLKK